ncbi:hypothetical protein [Paenibacillus thalictri]|uniref:Uncharacterized protein n=1 Tax=Paenibacillus thalictri TaxID=2527873 RepID=A0A4Q9DYN4_9BACL|nr:hypothetical protein [Paenibacillus thalictri]TBL80350.1 hypothetical protein EYB31_08005 [Paenibacillus thalictri]
MERNEQLEQQLAQELMNGESGEVDAQRLASGRLAHKYEVRVQATVDPIVEETRIVRNYVREVDDRYDEYLSRTDQTD